jgi:hypothetical protein
MRGPAFTWVLVFMVVSSFPSNSAHLIMRKARPKELKSIIEGSLLES